MTTDSYPLRLYVLAQQGSVLVLEPSSSGTPEVVRPAPPIFRTAYLNLPITDEMLAAVFAEIVRPTAHLLLFGPSPEGPPFRSAVVFTYAGTEKISYRDGSHSVHGKDAVLYPASTQASAHTWTSDATFHHEGYFLAGAPDASNLWHVERMEIDVANRCVFTLAPVELAAGLPHAKFDSVTDPVLKQEAENHWREVQEALLRHSYYHRTTVQRIVGHRWGRGRGCLSCNESGPLEILPRKGTHNGGKVVGVLPRRNQTRSRRNEPR